MKKSWFCKKKLNFNDISPILLNSVDYQHHVPLELNVVPFHRADVIFKAEYDYVYIFYDSAMVLGEYMIIFDDASMIRCR